MKTSTRKLIKAFKRGPHRKKLTQQFAQMHAGYLKDAKKHYGGKTLTARLVKGTRA